MPPDHVVDTLGPMPNDRAGRQRWQQTATASRPTGCADITDPHRSLGPEPDNPLQHDDHRRVLAAIQNHQRERHLEREPILARSRGFVVGRRR
jgi:hypothetical protein